ncbi:MAG: hypothetical protein ACLQVK_19725 [Acidimicrobiales bacterium]
MTALSAVDPWAPGTAAVPQAFQVTVIKPDGYMHSAALAEVAETVVFGFRSLGVGATLAVNELQVPGPPAVLLGAHLLTTQEVALVPSSAVIYNLEQVQLSSSWCASDYLGLLRRCQVWDYGKRNIASLRQLGLAGGAVHVPIGYVPQLTRIPRHPRQDIDVLFYGSINERRARVLAQLRDRGINTQAVFGVYGAARDSLIARAKVVLNLHYYETSIFEIVRVSYLLANRKAVVAECHDGTEIDEDMVDAVRPVRYEQLVDACAELVNNEHERSALEERALYRMSARPEAAFLAAALRESSWAPLTGTAAR